MTDKINVGIVGATGYTALELIKLLLRHPNVQITRITSRDESHPHLSDVHTSLRDRLDLRFEHLEMDRFPEGVDCVFCCLPHAASAAVVGQLLDANLKVIDFSADYRLNDVASFETWYGVEHPDAARIGSVAYGIPELFREQIKTSKLVANPGCFPSSAILPLAPLFKNGLVQSSPLIVDSKTGVSGAGRKANLKFHFPECNESITAYGVGTHRHMPEIDQILNRFCGSETEAVFTPHLVPMDRGILSTIYLQRCDGIEEDQLMDCLNEYYRHEPFVRVTSQIPSTKDVSGTNFCDITVRSCRGTTIIVSALDNMIKGASGAAVQNFNVMHGFEETLGLL
ncbi:N-acetyl-gamma-glutamyl-phosphate reductase [Mariniblastus fucicola]|uniref:N-acetyl-gamma-glutamyl-phosphate reductase n=1 Tax=Mariniblastus fucicola TaxID=980251 RepID=A0A5B9PN00_9BACT|nr:N-acetyl-gamma-glutamyl-phosphate reductase [Mariniblastus fucicola]QEG23693.1 N-acetyl-gamma-glutamyl-phosphate reductase [Mariniblastus fucicola]